MSDAKILAGRCERDGHDHADDERGRRGRRGHRGHDGATGATGAAGPTGNSGSAGATGPTGPGSTGVPDPQSFAYVYDDFTNLHGLFGINTDGTPATTVQQDTLGMGSGVGIVAGGPKAMGALYTAAANDGESNDGFCQWNVCSLVNSTAGLYETDFGASTATFTLAMRAALFGGSALIDGQQVFLGMPDGNTAPLPALATGTGLFFEIDPSAHGNANWWVNGVDTGVAPVSLDNNEWQNLSIVIPAPGTTALFFIEGVQVATRAVPASQYAIGGRAFSSQRASAPTTTFVLDYYLVTYPIDRTT